MTDGGLGQRPARRARGRGAAPPTSPSPVTWSSQPDDVPRLLAAELAAFALQRLEDVAVADVGRDHADAPVGHQLVEAEVRHRRDRDEVDAEVEGQDREDLVSVDRSRPARRPRACDRRRRRTRRRGRGRASRTVRERRTRSVAPQPWLMFVPSGSAPTTVRSAPSRRKTSGAIVGVRAVRAVDRDAQAARGRCRSARGRARDSALRRRRPARPTRSRSRGSSRKLSISSSASSVSFAPSRSKSLTPLYSGGLCDADTTAPRSRAQRATAGVGSTPPRTASPPADRIPRASASSSSRAGTSRVATHEDRPAADPDGRGAAEPLDEVGGQAVADDAANAVRSEVTPRHGWRSLPSVLCDGSPCESAEMSCGPRSGRQKSFEDRRRTKRHSPKR